MGYLSRASFKLVNYFWTLSLSVSYFDRIDYVSTISQEGLIINILELYLHSYISDYYSSIRSLFYELSRITNHLLAVITHGIDIGSLNCMLLAFEDRERILNLHEYLTGSRIHSSLLSMFTVRFDIPVRLLVIFIECYYYMVFTLKEIHALYSFSFIFVSRLLDIGKLDYDTIRSSSISGVIIRSSGYCYDIRFMGYESYDSTIPIAAVGLNGDCLCRYFIRINELFQSIISIVGLSFYVPFLTSVLSLTSS